MKQYNQESGDNLFYDRKFGRSLNPDDVYQKGILQFLNHKRDPVKAKLLAQKFINVLNRFIDWLNHNFVWHVFSSSLILAYDNKSDDIQLKWIDFANVVDAPGEKDENLLYGVQSLRSFLIRVIGSWKQRWNLFSIGVLLLLLYCLYYKIIY